MIFHGFQRLASGGISIENGNLLQRFLWSIQGLLKVIGGQRFDYYLSDWYWIPSRAIPGEPITEFPFLPFSMETHTPHLFSLPITLIALLWVLSILFIKDELRHSHKNVILSILFGSIVIGALKVTNTWDFPVFLMICLIILGYKLFQSYFANSFNKENHPENRGYSNLWSAIFLTILFVAMSVLIYYPFSKWYGQAYTSLEFWSGSHTPVSSYLTHWGYFFFITVSWWIWELWNWMANTP